MGYESRDTLISPRLILSLCLLHQLFFIYRIIDYTKSSRPTNTLNQNLVLLLSALGLENTILGHMVSLILVILYVFNA